MSIVNFIRVIEAAGRVSVSVCVAGATHSVTFGVLSFMVLNELSLIRESLERPT